MKEIEKIKVDEVPENLIEEEVKILSQGMSEEEAKKNKIKFINSELSPEFDIKIIQSLFVTIPRSPWLASEGWRKNEEEPIDESVEDIFFAIIPDLPTPDNIILPFLQLSIASTTL